MACNLNTSFETLGLQNKLNTSDGEAVTMVRNENRPIICDRAAGELIVEYGVCWRWEINHAMTISLTVNLQAGGSLRRTSSNETLWTSPTLKPHSSIRVNMALSRLSLINKKRILICSSLALRGSGYGLLRKYRFEMTGHSIGSSLTTERK